VDLGLDVDNFDGQVRAVMLGLARAVDGVNYDRSWVLGNGRITELEDKGGFEAVLYSGQVRRMDDWVLYGCLR
jgi:hypothetical protein